MIAFTNSEKIAELQTELNAKIKLRNKRQEYLHYITNNCKYFNDDIPEVETQIKVIKSEIAALEREIDKLMLENKVIVNTEVKHFCLYDKDMD